MATFTFEEYTSSSNSGSSNSVKIGFFKLADGDEALIRINAGTDLNSDLTFATVHAPVYGHTFEGLGSGFTPVSCLNEYGSYEDKCPFCKAAAEGHDVVGKAQKKVYVQMLVAYKDRSTGGWSQPVPVVWERPAGFAKELASKVKSYGSLREYVFKATRTGAGKDTRYTLDFIPMLNKPELIPVDFSAFNNFNIAKHSYWEKTADELNEYLANGKFSSDAKPANAVQASAQTPSAAPKAAPAPAPTASVVDDDLPFGRTPAPAAAPAAESSVKPFDMSGFADF